MRRRRDARDFRRRTIRGTLLLSRAHARLNDIEEHSGPPGTIGTGGTMVPRDGGGRVRPGPRDHPEAIIYMSSRDPQKNEGAAGWPGSRQAGLASGHPLDRRDHGPDGPDGPEGVEELLRRRGAPSRVSRGWTPHAPAPWVGTIGGDGLDAFWSDVATQIEKRKPQ